MPAPFRHATALVPAVRPDRLGPREVTAAFRELLAQGAALRPAGAAREDPGRLLTPALLCFVYLSM